MSYMTQRSDYYEDCCNCTSLAPFCKQTCPDYVPTCCSRCANCCDELPCVIREDRTIFKTLTPVFTPGRALCCKIPSRCYKKVICNRPYCDCAKCCKEPNSAVQCCVQEDDCCEKYDTIKQLLVGIILLVAFAVLVVNFNQLMNPCRRRRFFF